jgi:DNA processing protein
MPLSPSALEPLLRLAVVPGIGPGRLSSLLREFGSAERVLSIPPRQLAGLRGIGAEMARRLASAAGPAGHKRAARAMDLLDRCGAVALSPADRDYPEDFRLVADPPYLLFAVGKLDLLRRPGVGIVGTRRPSPYGLATADALGRRVAEEGYVVVSGMAAGIDTAAHAAALAVDGPTIGVLGHGIERVYPAANRALFREVGQEGLLLSEFPPGEDPKAGNFPRRNRLIAALSVAVVVVEMGLRSGAQHTVNAALDLGREVFAVPGPIGSESSAGTNQLLKDGARVLTSSDDIFEVLEGVGRSRRLALPPQAAAERRVEQLPLPVHLPVEQLRLLMLMQRGPRHVDELAADAAIPPGGTLAALLELELEGLVEALPGRLYRRA